MTIESATPISLTDFLMREFTIRNRQLLTETLKRVEPQNLKGTWLNMASGNGIYMEEVAKKAGIKRVIHFDIHPSLKTEYRNWLKTKFRSKEKVNNLANQNFRVISIADLIDKNALEKLKKPLCPEPVTGVMMINPWRDVQGLIWPAFEVGKIVLKPGQQMVVIGDRSEWPYLQDAAKRFWFTYEKQGSAGVFTQTGEYIR